MKKYIYKITLAVVTIFFGYTSNAQCPAITCPSNIIANNDPGNCSAVVNYTAPVGTDPCGTGSQTFNFTGGMQTFTVPVGVTTVTIVADGAQGGTSSGAGGQGGRATGDLVVVPGQILNVFVGGAGAGGPAAAGGFNGGGNGFFSSNGTGAGGGGASDVRVGGTALANRVIVGGGGAGGSQGAGGAGGGLVGSQGSTNGNGVWAQGGTQTAGGAAGMYNNGTCAPGSFAFPGSLGIGGDGIQGVGSCTQWGGAGGGGGYYGGGGMQINGAGGGSSYITGLTSASTTTGGRNGNGQITISYSGTAVTTIQTAGLPSGSAFPLGTTTNTFSATNAFGTVTCSFTVTVVDTEAPAITCPGPVTMNTDPGQCTSTAAIGTATATDNCTLLPVITNDAPASFPIGNTTVTWTATDGASNISTCTQVVTVVDAENPTITCPGAITINTDPGQCTSTASIGTATATDNCTVSPTITNDAPASFPIGNTTVTWTATDGSSNTSTCTQVVTVVDTEAPVITCPGAITINTDAGQCTSTAAIGTATATDNCTVSPTITNNAPASFPIGNTTVVWTATDGSGNIDTCHQVVTVVDAENPTITCPGAITINTDPGQCTSTASIGTATATDNCTASPTITNDAPVSFPIGNTTVTWTATDGSGNTSACTQVVTVVDAEAPVITCPANITVSNDSGMCDAVVNYTPPVGTDNCTGATTALTAGLASGSTFPVGTTTVTYTVTDGSSNTTSCSFTVTVTDTTLPTIICNANITVGNDPNMCSAVVNYTAPVGTDNCPGAVTTLSSGLASGSTFPVGVTTITYTVTDAANNVDSCSFTVTVADSIAPVAACQNFTLYLDNTGNVTLVADSIDGGSTDDCAIDTLISSPSTFTCNEVGANNVTLYVYDTYGNVDSCTAVVTVMDTIAPTATCQNINAYLDNTGNITIAAIDLDGGSADACGIDSMSISPSTFTCSEIGANSVTLIVTDVNGNIDSCVATVTVMDTLAPAVSCPSNQNVKTDITCVYEIGDYTSLAVNVTDNCDNNNVIITQIPVAGTMVTADNISNGEGQTTVTIIVQDQSGNIDSCDFVVDVECGAELSIPNVFTPNGDGKNDVWNIDGLDNFPDVTVSVFNRWGDLMFESDRGYTKSWDGTYNGTAAPAATYYYIVVLGSGEEGITGTINIIR